MVKIDATMVTKFACIIGLGSTPYSRLNSTPLLAAGMALCYFLRDRRSPAPWDEKETRLLRQCLLVALPLTVLSGYLQYTHTMRVDEWGNWNVGQST